MRNWIVSGDPVSMVIVKALKGKVSTFGLILILGFFSSFLLLYISLHVYFFDISQRIEASKIRLTRLTNDNLYLKSEYNELTSAKRILPLAKNLGMIPPGAGDVTNVAVRTSGGRVEYYSAHEVERKYVTAGFLIRKDEE